ncbi:MAG: translation initiation factor IF-2 [Planctomycetales bacterium]
MKIRIFALAKELNLDSKDLIEAFANIGIVLKNSALASVSPEERDQVIAYLKRESEVATAVKPAPAKPAVPVRDTGRNLGTKVPEIRTIIGKTAPPRTRPQDEPADEPEVAEEIETVSEPVVEESAPPAPQVPVSPAAAVAPAEPETPDQETPPEEPRAATPPRDPLAPRVATPRPLRPEDYIPASGAGTGLRAMMNKGSSSPPAAGGETKGARKPRPKPGPALPTLPKLKEFKGPGTTAVPEVAAQKPEMRLPPSVLSGQRPLDDILRRNAEEKRKTEERKKTKSILPEGETSEEEARPGRLGSKTMGLIGTGRKERTARRQRPGLEDDLEAEIRVRGPKRSRSHRLIAPQRTEAVISPPITIRSLSEAISRPANQLIKSLFIGKGMSVTMNSSLDEETAIELAMECGVELEIQRERDLEQEVIEASQATQTPESMQIRPPIITILGHVDHGKTTLLDKIRSANVAAGEAGGITQHIAAYQVEHNGHKLTFVDTPGHAAFTEMRARGANVTDIVVLVVAADDGVMPQTAEAISHARAAGVPMVVALNKIDLPSKNEQKVLQELSSNNVLPVEWGGDVEVVRTSGATGQGLDDLLETLLLTAELHELKANPDAPASGVCLEAFRDEGRGVVAWFIVQTGTLKVGDVISCGEGHGRIRAIYNDRNQEITAAGPSMPIKVSGLDLVPAPGDKFYVMPDLDAAREIVTRRQQTARAEALAHRGKPRTLEDILNPEKAGDVQHLPLILKADTPGSIEALKHEIGKFDHPEVKVSILHDGIGGVNESDVSLAQAAGAIIIAFHVVPEERARALSEQMGVEIRRYDIIYEVTDDIKLALEGLLKPEVRHVSTGRALVLRTFNISRFGTIAGCRVLNGTIERSNRIRVIRENRVLNDYAIGSLKREKDDAREVREGMECGIRLENFNDVKEGDLLEAYRVEEVKRTLS